MSDHYLTIPELADRLGKKPQTIHKYRMDSKPGGRFAGEPFPEPDRTIGRMPVWRVGRFEEIEAWVSKRIPTGRPRKANKEQ